jgi:hypothetical protein
MRAPVRFIDGDPPPENRNIGRTHEWVSVLIALHGRPGTWGIAVNLPVTARVNLVEFARKSGLTVEAKGRGSDLYVRLMDDSDG